MLRKLMKYEMKAMGRIMLPVYAILLVSAGVLAGYLHAELSGNALANTLLSRFDIVFVLLFVLIAGAASVMMAVLVIQRFQKNLLGQEGYLMFTLPATTGQHLISKGLTALIWILLGGVAGGFAGTIIVLESAPDMTPGEFVQTLQNAWRSLADYEGDGNQMIGSILIIAMLLVAIIHILTKVYAAFAIGHLWNNHRVLGGVIAYVVISILEGLANRLLRPDHLNELTNLSETGSKTLLHSSLFNSMASLMFSLIMAAIWYAVAWYILDKKLNLE